MKTTVKAIQTSTETDQQRDTAVTSIKNISNASQASMKADTPTDMIVNSVKTTFNAIQTSTEADPHSGSAITRIQMLSNASQRSTETGSQRNLALNDIETPFNASHTSTEVSSQTEIAVSSIKTTFNANQILTETDQHKDIPVNMIKNSNTNPTSTKADPKENIAITSIKSSDIASQASTDADLQRDIAGTNTATTFNANQTSTKADPQRDVAVTSFMTSITIIGLLANIVTFFTLTFNNDEFPRNGRILLVHQTVADMIVCLMSIGIYTQNYMWLTGNETFDLILCQAWHGQALYWGIVLVSVWNVVLIAYERFIVINKVNNPKNYRVIHKKDIIKTFITVYMMSFVFLLPAYFWLKYEHDEKTPKCSTEEPYFEGVAFEKFLQFYGVLWFLIVYAIPVGCLILLYTKMRLTLHQQHQTFRELIGNSNSMTIKLDNANRQITKTAIAQSIAFFISLSWDAFYCLLGFTGAIPYEFNKPLQVTGVFLATLNSCATPFIYTTTMPIFRKAFKEMFRCGRKAETLRFRLSVWDVKKDLRVTSLEMKKLNPISFFAITSGENKNSSDDKTLTGDSN